jgi:hypothetical protein
MSESQENTVPILILRSLNMFVLQMRTVIHQDYQMTILYTKYQFHLNFHTESQFA